MRRNWSFAVVLSLLLFAGCKNVSQAPSQPEQATIRPPSSGQYASETRSGRRRSRRGHADRQAEPGRFDYYLLNLSWSPEFCATHSDSHECGRGLGFVVHGLWPQDLNGDYPEDCSDAAGPSNPQAYTDLFPTASLVEHEWQTHGTCSGLSSDAYFAQVRKAFGRLKIPGAIGSGLSDGINPDELLGQVASANPSYPRGSFALSCGNNRLTAIEICLSKDLQPENCQGVRSCRAQVIRVTSR